MSFGHGRRLSSAYRWDTRVEYEPGCTHFERGRSAGPETNAITLGMNNRVTTMPGSKLSVNITASSGFVQRQLPEP